MQRGDRRGGVDRVVGNEMIVKLERKSNMSVQTPVPADHPMMIAWNQYRESEEGLNAVRWAEHREHVQGSLWAMFTAGWRTAVERAADLHPNVDNASDTERLAGIPGADAMGSVIDYRDQIRKLNT